MITRALFLYKLIRFSQQHCVARISTPGSARVPRVWFRRRAETNFSSIPPYLARVYLQAGGQKSPRSRDGFANTRDACATLSLLFRRVLPLRSMAEIRQTVFSKIPHGPGLARP